MAGIQFPGPTPSEPRRGVRTAADSQLVELLDRVLDKGAVLACDLVVTVAGVPLLALALRAALGDVDSMIAYGIFRADDPLMATVRDPQAPTIRPTIEERD